MILGYLKEARGYAVGAAGAFAFGVIDNGVMLLAGDQIDAYFAQYMDTMSAAGIGNTISDLVGVLAGGVVMYLLNKLFGKQEPSLAQEAVGITLGCLLPVAIRIIGGLS